VKSLCSEIPLIWRKDQALSALSKRKGFPADLFDVLHENFDGALNQLKADAQSTLDDIDRQTEKCDRQIKDLHSALINLEIEREIGRIEDKAYQTAMGIIQQALKQANDEKSDLESMKKQLSNIILGETAEEPPVAAEEEEEREEEAPPDSQLPEPPVMVDVTPGS
jgi:hypothetical protein